MKIGSLYKCIWKRTWVIHSAEPMDWSNALCVFLGKQIINRGDGVIIVNYRFFVNGKERTVDSTMLKYMEKIND